MNVEKTMAFLTMCVMAGALSAANITQVGRYETVDNKPSAAQINPLLTVQQVHFPTSIQTVGEALNYWVGYSGYHLADKDKLSSELSEVLSQNLPQVDRNFGPLTVQDGLEVLVGKQVFTLIQDPLHRIVSFKLNRKYQVALKKVKGARA